MLLIIEDGNIRLANSNTSYPFVNNFKVLLNGADINSINDKDALNNYKNLTKEAGSNIKSNRGKELMNVIYNLVIKTKSIRLSKTWRYIQNENN